MIFLLNSTNCLAEGTYTMSSRDDVKTRVLLELPPSFQMVLNELTAVHLIQETNRKENENRSYSMIPRSIVYA